MSALLDEDRHKGRGHVNAVRWEPPHHLRLRKCVYTVSSGEEVRGFQIIDCAGTLAADKRRHGEWIITQLPTGIACAKRRSLVQAVLWCRRVYRQHWMSWHTACAEDLTAFLKAASASLEDPL